MRRVAPFRSALRPGDHGGMDNTMLADATTALALFVTVIAGSVVLLVIAFHLYASWSIRNIDGSEER